MTTKKHDPHISYREADALNTDSILGRLMTPDIYYIDLSLFVDITFGAMVMLLNDNTELTLDEKEAVYKSFLTNYDKYVKRELSNPIPFIDNSKFKLATKQLENTLNDPTLGDKIFSYSPKTKFDELLKAQIYVNVNHTCVKDKFKKKSLPNKRYLKESIDITFVINTYPLHISSYLQNLIANDLCSLYKVNIKFINKPFNKLYHKQIDRIDEFYVSDLHLFLDHPFIQEKLNKFNYQEKRLFVSPYFDGFRSEEYYKEKKEIETKKYNIYQRISMSLCWYITMEFLPHDTFDISSIKKEEK